MDNVSLFVVGWSQGMKYYKAAQAVYVMAEAIQQHEDDTAELRASVCYELINSGIDDEPTLTASLLYWVVGKGYVTSEVVREKFGYQVAFLVNLLVQPENQPVSGFQSLFMNSAKIRAIKHAENLPRRHDLEGINKEASYVVGRLKALERYAAVEAVFFIVKAHHGEKRDDGKTDYSEHPIRMCRMSLILGETDEPTLTSGLLHDTVENGRATLEEVREKFGQKVAHLVSLMTKESGESKQNHFGKCFSELESAMNKGKDRVCNVDDMIDVFPLERLERYIIETRDEIMPRLKILRRQYLQYADILIIMRDYLKGILRAAEKIVVLMKENKEIRLENERLKERIKQLEAA